MSQLQQPDRNRGEKKQKNHEWCLSKKTKQKRLSSPLKIDGQEPSTCRKVNYKKAEMCAVERNKAPNRSNWAHSSIHHFQFWTQVLLSSSSSSNSSSSLARFLHFQFLNFFLCSAMESSANLDFGKVLVVSEDEERSTLLDPSGKPDYPNVGNGVVLGSNSGDGVVDVAISIPTTAHEISTGFFFWSNFCILDGFVVHWN